MIKKIEDKIKKREAERKRLNIHKPKKKTKKELEDEEDRKKDCFLFYVRALLNNPVYITWMTLITIYALFFDDIRLIAFPGEYDDYFFGVTLVGMILFFQEICMSTYATPRYKLSFFFWLDLVSTISMIPDCGWIWNAIIDQ